MTSRARRRSRRAASRWRAKSIGSGFTLIEVMAAVLVLGLLFTWLANVAMIGLRSEGIDRRRADAEMIADRELSALETQISSGEVLEDGRVERDEAPYVVRTDVEPADVLAMLPAQLRADVARTTDPKARSVLHDERGQSRVRRVTVEVEWDEAGEPDSVERTTFAFDSSVLEQYFPTADAGSGTNLESEVEKVRKMAPPEIRALMGKPARGRSR